MYKLIISFILITSSCLGQSVSVIDFVQTKDNKSEEVIYYYENNWKVYRDEALKQNYILSYKLLKVPADSIANFDIILITEYADSSQHALAEPRFQEIIKGIRPNGPILLNDIKPNDFRQIIFSKNAETILNCSRKEN